MFRRILTLSAVFILFACGIAPETVQSGIVVAITDISVTDGPNENVSALESDAVRTASCPSTNLPEDFTNTYINLLFFASYMIPPGTTVRQDYNWVHLQSYTLTYTPKDTGTTATIPDVTRNVQLDIEIGGSPELTFLFVTTDQKDAWVAAQADFGDFLPKEYNVLMTFVAVDPRGNPVKVGTEFPVTIGSFDNC